MKERIPWIDIAKGLMIIGMVLNHIPNICSREGVYINAFPWYLVGGAYGSFTMQAFFVLSGYTTNFDQPFRVFIGKQIKGLLLPYFSFLLLFSTFDYFVYGKPFIYDAFGEKVFFLTDGYWFLTALFIAKVSMYVLNKLFNNNKRLWLWGGVLLLIIGISISEWYSEMPEPSHWHNWFHYRNGLCMAIFLPIGYFMKKYQVAEKYGLYLGLSYCVFYCASFLLARFDVPYYQYFLPPSYTHYLGPNLKEVNGFLIIPQYLFYTVMGSAGIFWLSYKIRQNKCLEYFGTTSLVVYCVHFTFLTLIVKLVSPLIPHEDIISAGLLFIIIAVLTLGTSALAAYLFEKKPLRYFIGKF